MDSLKYKIKIRRIYNCVVSISIVCMLMLTLFCVTYYIGGEMVYSSAIASRMSPSARRMANSIADEYEFPYNDTSWIATAEKLSVAKTSNSDLELYAVQYLAETESHVWVITLHGYRSSWAEMAGFGIEFHNHGYNVLIPNLRGHGICAYKHLGMGYFDRIDVLSWIEYIITIDSDAEIILHGRSMGGAAVMMTTGETLPANVKCAIEDCGYTNVYDEFTHVVKNVMKYPLSDLLIFAGNNVTKRKIGVSLKDMDSIAQLKKSTTPTLFIHGNQDSFVPFWMLDRLYGANDSIMKEKLVIDGAEHGMASTVNPELYFSTVYAFIDRFLS